MIAGEMMIEKKTVHSVAEIDILYVRRAKNQQ
jgi:hypothetical protein